MSRLWGSGAMVLSDDLDDIGIYLQGLSNATAPSSLLTGLTDYNAFASASFLADSTGHGNTLTNIGGATQADVVITGVTVGSAVLASASSQTLTLANLSTSPGTSGSVSLWLNIPGNQGGFAFALDLGNSGSELAVFFDGSGTTVLLAGTSVTDTPGSTLTPSTWTSVIITWDPVHFVQLYVNGTLIGANSDIPTFAGPAFPLTLGGQTGGGFLYDGSIAAVGIWATRTLTSLEIATLSGGGASGFFPFH